MVRWCFCCYCCCCCCWKIRARYCVTASPRHSQGSAVGGWSGRVASLLRSLQPAHDHDHSDSDEKGSSHGGLPPYSSSSSGRGSCGSPVLLPTPPHRRRAASLKAPGPPPARYYQPQSHPDAHHHHQGLHQLHPLGHHTSGSRPRYYGSASDLLVHTQATKEASGRSLHRASLCTCAIEAHIRAPKGEPVSSTGRLDPREDEPDVVVLGAPRSKEESGRRYTALLSGLDRIRSRLTGSSSNTSSASDKRTTPVIDYRK